MKYLVVDLEMRGVELWRMSFAEIAAHRIAHFAKEAEVAEGTDAYKRLVRVSETQSEVIDWARRVLASEKIRHSWFAAKITIEDDGWAVAEPVEVKDSAPSSQVVSTGTPKVKRKYTPRKSKTVPADPSSAV